MEQPDQVVSSLPDKVLSHPLFVKVFHVCKIIQLFTTNILMVAADVGTDIYTAIAFHR